MLYFNAPRKQGFHKGCAVCLSSLLKRWRWLRSVTFGLQLLFPSRIMTYLWKNLGYLQDGGLLCDMTQSHQYFNLNLRILTVQKKWNSYNSSRRCHVCLCVTTDLRVSYFLDVPSASLKCCRSDIRVGWPTLEDPVWSAFHHILCLLSATDPERQTQSKTLSLNTSFCLENLPSCVLLFLLTGL